MISLPFDLDIEFSNIVQIEPKHLKIRKKLNIYKAIDTNNTSYCILYVAQKSRMLQKDVDNFEEIYEKIKDFTSTNFDRKIIAIDAPLCSKAKAKFELLKWEVVL